MEANQNNLNSSKEEIKYGQTGIIPFNLINRGEGWEIVVGLQLVTTKKFKTKGGARRYLKKKPWEVIFSVATAITQLSKEENKKQEQS